MKTEFFIYYKTIIVKYSIFCPVNIFSAFFVCKTCYIHTRNLVIQQNIYTYHCLQMLLLLLLSENSAESFKIMHESRLIFT